MPHSLKFRNAALGLACCMSAALLAGCGPEDAPHPAPLSVYVQTVELVDYTPKVALTGEIRARVQTDLSFRVTGRLKERNVDVGTHVDADQVLARIETKEQEADVGAATAGVQAAEARLRQVSSSFERQKTLLQRGFTTQRDHDKAEQDFRTAQASLDSARAQLAATRDQLTQTVLRAPAPGIITVRNMELGQVAQAAQPVFTLAQDGPRDAIINVQEDVFGIDRIDDAVEVGLSADPAIKMTGEVREVAPAIDPVTGTVRVKVGLMQTPPEMVLGSSVTVTVHIKPRKMAVLPWSALFSDGDKPAVWIVDRQTQTVSLRQVALESYSSSSIVVRDGLQQGDTVVTSGAQLLRPAQKVAFGAEANR